MDITDSNQSKTATSVAPSNNDLDEWIEQLFDCKQLSENQVKTVCDKVSLREHFILSKL